MDQPQTPNQAREEALTRLGGGAFDLLVIGGGATGCGIARDAALRGFSVALVEKTDLAAGTSSRSSKLIHGGLRYLEHAQFKLVFEGTNERALLARRAPHLVRPIPFLLPAYKESRPGLLKLDVGLWIYDALSKFSSPKLHKTYRAAKVHEMEPLLRTEALKGGIVYYDCITDDARITLESAIDARALGATIATYTRAVGLLRDAEERVCGVEVEDAETGRRTKVAARVTVNATGPWSDEILSLMGEAPILKPTKGVHVVVDAARLPLQHAVVMLAARDHRVMFGIPWGNRTIIGTTDTFYGGSLDRLTVDEDDVAYLLETANQYCPSACLGPDDVIATWAGLRPLLAPDSGVAGASDVSREHHIIERPGFITIAGGKLTTFRRMAAEVVDRVGHQLGRVPPSRTEDRQFPGADGLTTEADVTALGLKLIERGLPARVARHLADTYGARAEEVARRALEDPMAAAPLVDDQPHMVAEVDEAVEHGMARSLVDVLARRVPLVLRARDQALGIAPAVAERMARLLDWSPARVRQEIDLFASVVADSRAFRA